MQPELVKSIEQTRSFDSVRQIEEILCLATLIATGILPHDANWGDAKGYNYNLPDGDCGNCPCFDKCLACIINEQEEMMQIYDEHTVSMPDYALSYIINGEQGGLTDEEVSFIDKSLQKYYDEAKNVNGDVYIEQVFDPVTLDCKESYFTWFPEFGLPCTCYDVKIFILVSEQKED